MRSLTTLLTTAAFAATAVQAGAQTRPGTRVEVEPSSKVTISGTSTLHAWSCSSSDIKATITVGSQTVKINGKAAARMGDTAKTCNDPADAPVGTVIAAGTVLIG